VGLAWLARACAGLTQVLVSTRADVVKLRQRTQELETNLSIALKTRTCIDEGA
jgi:BMFP domain-containing protein YqiC